MSEAASPRRAWSARSGAERLTLAELDVLRHAVGLPQSKRPYRNGFKAGKGMMAWATCESLVTRGLFARHAAGEDVYTVTEAGFKRLFPKRWAEMKARAER